MNCLFKNAGVTFPGHATTCCFGRFPGANWLAEQRVEVNLVEVGLEVNGVMKGPQNFEILRAFHDPIHLQPYLDQIDIDTLLR